MPKQGGNISASGVSPKWVKSNERRKKEREKEERKSKITMVSTYA